MSKKPNFASLGSQAIGGFSSQSNFETKAAAKPFDGFKTTNIASRKPFEFKGVKSGNATDYGGQMGIGALEKDLVRDIETLDWELNSQPRYTVADTKAKPKLFFKKEEGAKKSDFNYTGETKATVGLDDWDLPSEPTKPSEKPRAAIQAKQAKVDMNDWDIHESNPKPSMGAKPAKNENVVDKQVVGGKNIKKNINMELEANDAEFEKLYECPEGCGRSFRRNALEKHMKVCRTVFQNKKKEETASTQKVAPTSSSKPDQKEEGHATSNNAKWKKDSENLRKLIKKGKGEKVEEPVDVIELPEKVCDICSKNFSEGAYQRHRPVCESKKRYHEGELKK